MFTSGNSTWDARDAVEAGYDFGAYRFAQVRAPATCAWSMGERDVPPQRPSDEQESR